jgi:hypothetical protein
VALGERCKLHTIVVVRSEESDLDLGVVVEIPSTEITRKPRIGKLELQGTPIEVVDGVYVHIVLQETIEIEEM